MEDRQPDIIDPLAGPIELNLLERVEYGMAFSDNQSEPKPENSVENDTKFDGKREVIFVSGWANIPEIFSQQRNVYFLKTALASAMLFSFHNQQQNPWLVALVFVMFNLILMISAARNLRLYWSADPNLRATYWIEINEALGYQIFFLGFLLFYREIISGRTLPLFCIPLALVSFIVFCFVSEEQSNTKKFLIFEAAQCFLIAAKMSGMINTTWNYALFISMAVAIYMAVLGIFLFMILACCLVGFFQRQVESYKLVSLIWLTWNYTTTGFVYAYIIRCIIHFFNDDGLRDKPTVTEFVGFKNTSATSDLEFAMILLFTSSAISLLAMFVFKAQLLKFFTKIIYRKEVRKEVSLRFFSKYFTYRLIQSSATYFLKADKKDQTKQVDERDQCIMCCDQVPNAMIDNCGHGGFCKDCIVNYLKSNGEKCPFCKKSISKILMIEFDKENGQFMTKGEIKITQ